MLRGDRSREVTALAGITCALGLVYLWRKLNVLTRRVVTLRNSWVQMCADVPQWVCMGCAVWCLIQHRGFCAACDV